MPPVFQNMEEIQSMLIPEWFDEMMNNVREYRPNEGRHVVDYYHLFLQQLLLSDVKCFNNRSLPPVQTNFELEAPVIVQIEEARDVSRPLSEEHTQAGSRSMKLLLYDGKTKVIAFEHEHIPSLDYPVKYGTKLLLRGYLEVTRGTLLLTPRNTMCLGGWVKELEIQRAAKERYLQREPDYYHNPNLTKLEHFMQDMARTISATTHHPAPPQQGVPTPHRPSSLPPAAHHTGLPASLSANGTVIGAAASGTQRVDQGRVSPRAVAPAPAETMLEPSFPASRPRSPHPAPATTLHHDAHGHTNIHDNVQGNNAHDGWKSGDENWNEVNEDVIIVRDDDNDDDDPIHDSQALLPGVPAPLACSYQTTPSKSSKSRSESRPVTPPSVGTKSARDEAEGLGSKKRAIDGSWNNDGTPSGTPKAKKALNSLFLIPLQAGKDGSPPSAVGNTVNVPSPLKQDSPGTRAETERLLQPPQDLSHLRMALVDDDNSCPLHHQRDTSIVAATAPSQQHYTTNAVTGTIPVLSNNSQQQHRSSIGTANSQQSITALREFKEKITDPSADYPMTCVVMASIQEVCRSVVNRDGMISPPFEVTIHDGSAPVTATIEENCAIMIINRKGFNSTRFKSYDEIKKEISNAAFRQEFSDAVRRTNEGLLDFYGTIELKVEECSNSPQIVMLHNL